MKKAISLLVAAFMAVTMAAPAFAAKPASVASPTFDEEYNDGGIIYKNYTVYDDNGNDVEVAKVVRLWDKTVASVTVPEIAYTPEGGGYYVQGVGNGAFEGCTNLTSVSLPYRVTFIGASAFQGTPITSITIPGHTTSIGASAFQDCTSLSRVKFDSISPVFGENSFDNIAPGAVASIYQGFVGFDQGDFNPVAYPFVNGSPLKIDADSVRSQFVVDDVIYRITSMSPNTVTVSGPLNRQTITQAIIPETVASPYTGASYTVTALDRQLEYMGTFSGCPNLEYASLPGTITSSNAYTFMSCPRLQDIILGEGITHIDTWFARGCDSLSFLTIPSTVTSIGTQAFANTYLYSIEFKGTTAPSFGDGCFDNIGPGAVAGAPTASIGTQPGQYNPNNYPFKGNYPIMLFGY